MTISIPMPSAVSGAVALGAFLPVIARSTVDNRYFETAGSSAMLDRQLRTAIAYSAVRDRIEVWKALPSDWDGREGIPPPECSAATAKRILRRLEINGIRAPDPYVAGDGEVGFSWTSARGFASISILADGHVAALVRPTSGEPFRVDELEKLVPLDQLVVHISRVT